MTQTSNYSSLTLAQTLHEASEERWRGLRSYNTSMSQSRMGLADLTLVVNPELANQSPAVRNTLVVHSEVTEEHVAKVVQSWRAQNRAATLINRRLVCFSVMKLPATGHYQRIPRKLKWWLKPDQEATIVRKLRAYNDDLETLVADYIEWARYTGFRVEESLRLTRSSFAVMPEIDPETGAELVKVVCTVPGLKTVMAEATLPLAPEAMAIFLRRLGPDAEPNARLFPISYDLLSIKWRECKAMIGASQAPGATLKALRRTAARHLHAVKGVPLDMVRHYLRHETIKTTMEYLRLTGGYSTDEFARYL